MSADKKTPSEWAKETAAPDGKPNYTPCRYKWQRPLYSWQHAAARVRHGWADHELATSAEIDLSRDDYLAALKAVSDPKQKGPGIHVPAVSPYCVATDETATAAGVPEMNAANRAVVLERITEASKRNAMTADEEGAAS